MRRLFCKSSGVQLYRNRHLSVRQHRYGEVNVPADGVIRGTGTRYTNETCGLLLAGFIVNR